MLNYNLKPSYDYQVNLDYIDNHLHASYIKSLLEILKVGSAIGQ